MHHKTEIAIEQPFPPSKWWEKEEEGKKTQPEDRQQAVAEEPTHRPSDDISCPGIPPLDVFLFSFSLDLCLSLSLKQMREGRWRKRHYGKKKKKKKKKASQKTEEIHEWGQEWEKRPYFFRPGWGPKGHALNTVWGRPHPLLLYWLIQRGGSHC